MLLDVFNDDAFSLLELSQAVTLLLDVPTKIGRMGLFTQEGITTTDVAIELVGSKLTLVPSAPRGAPGVAKGLERRQMKKLSTVHLPQRCSVYADEVLGLRAFGKKTEVEVARDRLMRKIAVCRRDIEVTMEYQRMGAIKGKVLDADGVTVLVDLFAEFGVTQVKIDMALDNANTLVRSKCTAVARAVEDALGGVAFSEVVVLCSPEFFDALVDHKSVSEAYKYHSAASQMRDDLREGFTFGNHLRFVEYRGKVNNTRFIEAGVAYAVPLGVPDLCTTNFAPADHIDAVNQPGLPFYSSLEPLPFGKGIDCLTQSNPLHIVNRPNAVIKLGLNAAAIA